MPIELYWDNDEQTVMLCEIRDPWTWDDLFATLEKMKKVTDRASYTIGAILDVTGGVKLPGGSLFSPATRDNALKMIKMGEGGSGPVVVVGASPMIKAIHTAALTLDRHAASHFRFVKTMDEARNLMAQMLPSHQTA